MAEIIERRLKIAILSLLRESGEYGMTTMEVAKACGVSYDVAQRVLISLRSNDQVKHGNRGGSWRVA